MKIIGTIVGALLVSTIFAQSDMIQPRLSLSYQKVNDDVPLVLVKARKRIDRRFYSLENIDVKLYLDSIHIQSLLGSVNTNSSGDGVVEFPVELMDRWYKNDIIKIIGVVEQSDSIASTITSLEIVKGRLEIKCFPDSSIVVTLLSKRDSNWIPEPGAEVKFAVKRHFGNLPITDAFIETDVNGQASTMFALKVPGDSIGMLTIMATIEDHYDLGSIIASTKVIWGTKQALNGQYNEKESLWATRNKAPVWLLIMANSMISAVLLVILYILFQLRKIINMSNS